MIIALKRIDGPEDDYLALRKDFFENLELNGIGVCHEWDIPLRDASKKHPDVTVSINVVTRYEDYTACYRDGRLLH